MVMDLVPDKFTNDDATKTRILKATFPGVTLADLRRSPTQCRDGSSQYVHDATGDVYAYWSHHQTWSRTNVSWGLPASSLPINDDA
jgi:hypothetical protein